MIYQLTLYTIFYLNFYFKYLFLRKSPRVFKSHAFLLGCFLKVNDLLLRMHGKTPSCDKHDREFDPRTTDTRSSERKSRERGRAVRPVRK